MYPNLDAEMTLRGIKRKDLAWLFNNRRATVSEKLNGKTPIMLDEAFKIKLHYFPNLSIDYLFASRNEITLYSQIPMSRMELAE